MATLAFFDKIVNATELRRNQKFWLDKAAKQPVTVTYGIDSLAILNREYLRKLHQQNYFLEKALKLCTGSTQEEKNSVFPWLDYLDPEGRDEFIHEFVSTLMRAIIADDFTDIEILLDDWKATAETQNDKEAMKVLKTKASKDEYVALK